MIVAGPRGGGALTQRLVCAGGERAKWRSGTRRLLFAKPEKAGAGGPLVMGTFEAGKFRVAVAGWGDGARGGGGGGRRRGRLGASP